MPLAKHAPGAPGPLNGLLVVAIEQALAAPLCSGRLAELGARVIKVERAEGDFARGYDQAANGEASYFVWTNSGKESLVLDFKDEEDANLLHRLIAKADVVIQNLAPGALERAGFGSEALRELHPRLITCDVTGYGTSEAVGHLKAYDMLVQCESGLATVTGVPEAPGRVGVSICDIGAGMNATIAVLSALAQRGRTGRGMGVSVSLFDGAADWMSVPYVHEVYGTGAPQRLGLRHPSIAPYATFATSEGDEIVIAIQNEREWKSFCLILVGDPALATDPRFGSNTLRVRNREALEQVISEAFGRLTIAEAVKLLSQAGVAFGQVRSVAELARHPALRTWPMQVGSRTLDLVAPPVQAPWNRGAFLPAPKLGEHSASLRQEFSALASKRPTAAQ